MSEKSLAPRSSAFLYMEAKKTEQSGAGKMGKEELLRLFLDNPPPVKHLGEKYFITGGYGWNDCNNKPIEVIATSRTEAISRAGFTVWTEDEWASFDYAQFMKDCAEMKR